MEKSKWGVHLTHCCALHGCKYGDHDCPVTNGLAAQVYMCEDCYDEVITPVFNDKPVIIQVSIIDGLNIFFNAKKFVVLEKETKLNIDINSLEVGTLVYISSMIENQNEVISEANFVTEKLSSVRKNNNINLVKNLLNNSKQNSIVWKKILISSIEKYGELTIASIASSDY